MSVRYERKVTFPAARRLWPNTCVPPAPTLHFPPCSQRSTEDLRIGRSKGPWACAACRSSTRRAHNQQERDHRGKLRLLKIDTLDNRSISDKIGRAIETADCRDKIRRGGIQRLSPRRVPIAAPVPQLTPAIPAGAFRVADSQVASRWGISSIPGFRSHHAERARSPVRTRGPGFGRATLALELHKRARCKTLDSQVGDRRDHYLPFRLAGE